MNLDNFKPIDLDIIHDSLITEKTNRINQKTCKFISDIASKL